MTSRSSALFRWRTRPSLSRKSSSRRTGRLSHTTATAARLCTPWWPRRSTTATTRAKWKPVAYPKSAASWSTSQVGSLKGVGLWRACEVSVLESALGSESLFCSRWSEWVCAGRAVMLMGKGCRASQQSAVALEGAGWAIRSQPGHSVHPWPWVSDWPSPCHNSDFGMMIPLQDCYKD